MRVNCLVQEQMDEMNEMILPAVNHDDVWELNAEKY